MQLKTHLSAIKVYKKDHRQRQVLYKTYKN